MAESNALTAPPPAFDRRAQAVARGICRLFARNDIWALAEMPLRNGRRDLIQTPRHPGGVQELAEFFSRLRHAPQMNAE